MNAICRKICDEAERVGFVDPLTGLRPQDEDSLSALLCIYHQAGRISWDQVPLLLPSKVRSEHTAAAIFGISAYLCTEYPLFWKTSDELQTRGGMRPDILFLSHDRGRAAFIESKIGAGDTHKGDGYGGQFGRYLMYLGDSGIRDTSLILLTAEDFVTREPPWYIGDLHEAQKLYRGSTQVGTFVMTWESVLGALRR
jgi:hypothetical protein